ncbi:MAG TPA: chemotaxis protein CheB [Thermoanaerobaculia bacterium]|nr:chemotaxis protein CheB [Thermoanaerobaculia bacterium]
MTGVRRQASEKTGRADLTPDAQGLTPELIVVGCSLGGMDALEKILKKLPQDCRVPIAVAQHRHRRSDESLPAFLSRSTHMRVVDVVDKQWIEPGKVYLAPPDYHLLVAKGEFNLSVDEAVRHSRPSVDVLFESAADAYGPNLIGIVLTGANEDGAAGAQRIKQRGGTVIVQDPKTAEAPTMPEAVIATGVVDQILNLEEIAAFVAEHCRVALTP